MEAKTIRKYDGKSQGRLIAIADRHFNSFIRNRDSLGDYFKCISCKKTKRIIGDGYQAGHYFAKGHHPFLRYVEDNVHGQCKACNYFLSGNLAQYAENLKEKIGDQRFNRLNLMMFEGKRARFKWCRIRLIEVIEEYKQKKKKVNSLIVG